MNPFLAYLEKADVRQFAILAVILNNAATHPNFDFLTPQDQPLLDEMRALAIEAHLQLLLRSKAVAA